jgi:hypothetical protein
VKAETSLLEGGGSSFFLRGKYKASTAEMSYGMVVILAENLLAKHDIRNFILKMVEKLISSTCTLSVCVCVCVYTKI